MTKEQMQQLAEEKYPYEDDVSLVRRAAFISGLSHSLTPPADVQERAKGSWKPAVKPENAQCTEVCTIDEDYPIEIMAEGVHCLGCGRKRPPTKYYLAGASSLQAENERLREILKKVAHYNDGKKPYDYHKRTDQEQAKNDSFDDWQNIRTEINEALNKQ